MSDAPQSHPVRDGALALAVGSLVALLVIFGLKASGAPGESPGTDQPSAPATALTRDACEPQPGSSGNGPAEPDPVPGPDFPRQEVIVDTGAPATVSATGNGEVAYTRFSEFATVVEFSCPECEGNLDIFNVGSGVYILRTLALPDDPQRFQWLVDTEHDFPAGPDNSLLVEASGPWTLTLRSWHDLPVETGPLTGTASAVKVVAADAAQVSFAPLNSRDALRIFAYDRKTGRATGSVCIGRYETEEVDFGGGDALLIWALGDWRLEPS